MFQGRKINEFSSAQKKSIHLFTFMMRDERGRKNKKRHEIAFII
jgi:hypothetical protein